MTKDVTINWDLNKDDLTPIENVGIEGAGDDTFVCSDYILSNEDISQLTFI